MELQSILDAVFQQGIWCILFVYLFYTNQNSSKEREDRLTNLLAEQGKQIENIANTLETINDRIDKVEDKIE